MEVFQLIVKALVPRSLDCRAEEDLMSQTFVIRASAGEVGVRNVPLRVNRPIMVIMFPNVPDHPAGNREDGDTFGSLLR